MILAVVLIVGIVGASSIGVMMFIESTTRSQLEQTDFTVTSLKVISTLSEETELDITITIDNLSGIIVIVASTDVSVVFGN